MGRRAFKFYSHYTGPPNSDVAAPGAPPYLPIFYPPTVAPSGQFNPPSSFLAPSPSPHHARPVSPAAVAGLSVVSVVAVAVALKVLTWLWSIRPLIHSPYGTFGVGGLVPKAQSLVTVLETGGDIVSVGAAREGATQGGGGTDGSGGGGGGGISGSGIAENRSPPDQPDTQRKTRSSEVLNPISSSSALSINPKTKSIDTSTVDSDNTGELNVLPDMMQKQMGGVDMTSGREGILRTMTQLQQLRSAGLIGDKEALVRTVMQEQLRAGQNEVLGAMMQAEQLGSVSMADAGKAFLGAMIEQKQGGMTASAGEVLLHSLMQKSHLSDYENVLSTILRGQVGAVGNFASDSGTVMRAMMQEQLPGVGQRIGDGVIHSMVQGQVGGIGMASGSEAVFGSMAREVLDTAGTTGSAAEAALRASVDEKLGRLRAVEASEGEALLRAAMKDRLASAGMASTTVRAVINEEGSIPVPHDIPPGRVPVPQTPANRSSSVSTYTMSKGPENESSVTSLSCDDVQGEQNMQVLKSRRLQQQLRITGGADQGMYATSLSSNTVDPSRSGSIADRTTSRGVTKVGDGGASQEHFEVHAPQHVDTQMRAFNVTQSSTSPANSGDRATQGPLESLQRNKNTTSMGLQPSSSKSQLHIKEAISQQSYETSMASGVVQVQPSSYSQSNDEGSYPNLITPSSTQNHLVASSQIGTSTHGLHATMPIRSIDPHELERVSTHITNLVQAIGDILGSTSSHGINEDSIHGIHYRNMQRHWSRMLRECLYLTLDHCVQSYAPHNLQHPHGSSNFNDEHELYRNTET